MQLTVEKLLAAKTIQTVEEIENYTIKKKGKETGIFF